MEFLLVYVGAYCPPIYIPRCLQNKSHIKMQLNYLISLTNKVSHLFRFSLYLSIKDLLMSRENGFKAGLLCPPASALRISAQYRPSELQRLGLFKLKKTPIHRRVSGGPDVAICSAGPVRAPGFAFCGLEGRRLAVNTCSLYQFECVPWMQRGVNI